MNVSGFEILKRYSEGERNFNGIELCSENLIGANLSEANFSRASLANTNLANANLERAIFTNADLSGAYLGRANLRHTDLSGASFCIRRDRFPTEVTDEALHPARLEAADLAQANLSGADLRKVCLQNANLQGANLADANLEGADLLKANLSGANLAGANLTNSNLCFASLADANLTGTNLDRADVIGAIMPDGTLIPNQAAEFIQHKLAHLQCLAWQPIVRAGDGDLKSSKFAGKPWLSASESYPNCPNCQNLMEFILQLNLEELPQAVNQKFGKGLFQLFYCFQDECDVDYEGWAAFSPVQIVRIIQPEGEPAEFEVPVIEGECLSKQVEGPLPAKLIVGWAEIQDYPDWRDLESYGITLTEGEHQQLITLLPSAIKGTYWDWRGAVGAFMKEAGLHAPSRDKLAGYPHWQQGTEDCPNCPICDARMNQLIAQLESNDNIPVYWGDVGSGYIVQCPRHQEQVAFFWQCG